MAVAEAVVRGVEAPLPAAEDQDQFVEAVTFVPTCPPKVTSGRFTNVLPVAIVHAPAVPSLLTFMIVGGVVAATVAEVPNVGWL